MNAISVFQFNQSDVRVEVKEGEPLFCLTDVAEILDIKNANPSRFNMSEAGVHLMYIRSNGQNREVTFINEPNLYRVIFRSRKAEAVQFQNWIFEEVIPQIRKTGSYAAKTTPAEREGLRQAVNYLVGKRHLNFDEAYRLIHQRFSVTAIDEIPAAALPQAVAYCHALALDTALHGEVIDPVPSPLGRRCPAGTNEGLTLAAEELADITRLAYYYEQMSLFYDHILPVFRRLESSYAGRVHNYSHEYRPSLCAVQKIICRLAKKMPDNECRQRIGQMMIRMNQPKPRMSGLYLSRTSSRTCHTLFPHHANISRRCSKKDERR